MLTFRTSLTAQFHDVSFEAQAADWPAGSKLSCVVTAFTETPHDPIICSKLFWHLRDCQAVQRGSLSISRAAVSLALTRHLSDCGKWTMAALLFSWQTLLWTSADPWVWPRWQHASRLTCLRWQCSLTGLEWVETVNNYAQCPDAAVELSGLWQGQAIFAEHMAASTLLNVIYSALTHSQEGLLD